MGSDLRAAAAASRLGSALPEPLDALGSALIAPVARAAVQEMCSNPYETQSDSFYYVGETMIMHNKAKYAYTDAA